MDDLRVPAGPGIPVGLVVPARDLAEQFSRSSGPGGQHVNTSDSRVQLSLDLGATTALTETQRSRVRERLSARLAGTVLTVSSEGQRSQLRNRNAARQRLAELLREALAPPVERRATKPSRNSRRRRVRTEQRRSEIKQNRRRPRFD
ncbi:alternative ribosome rescue aminoacyl-tRNA hydrolase ArfB [Brevibacterium aurantiacum]|uniref:Aminoacyl-tRNA hydrolase n=1 Tax=Brevibacterium aurantiacum TaxID=273384 RepID=A0A2H1JEC4_BREAU|nr:alternative ribosome rescue aminoacyl-tRNA hydrolase ArfB [Brevibacterium aurantiacum]PCC45416.1 aminoacyl-tRNA hydrolase [Brevibacterium aurantiacum]SMX72390.1 ribosome-associated protein [Brevibacterium aurantiacum]SMX85830.1 ribosome-associated protein [Brevibacterium aurantiacum]